VGGRVKVQLYSIPNLGGRWGWVVKGRPSRFTSGRETRYPFYTRLGWPQGPCGQVWELSRLPGSDPRNVQPAKSRYTNHTSRPTRVRMTEAAHILTLNAFMAWIIFFYVSSSRNPNKKNLQKRSFKRMDIAGLLFCYKAQDGNIEHVGATLTFCNCIWDVSGSNGRRHTIYPDKLSMVLFSSSGRIVRKCLDKNTTTSITFPVLLLPDIALSILRYLRC
jgi:hypothetical protein